MRSLDVPRSRVMSLVPRGARENESVMTTTFGLLAGTPLPAGGMARKSRCPRGRGQTLRVCPIRSVIENDGILFFKLDPLDSRLHVDSRFQHGCDSVLVLCPLGLVTRENRAALFQVLQRRIGVAGIGARQPTTAKHVTYSTTLGFMSPPRHLIR